MKVDFKNFEFVPEKVEQNGITIVNRIPYEQKENFAIDLVNMTIGTEDKTGAIYTLGIYDLIENYLFAKYYTDIDVDDVVELDDYRKLYDYMQSHNANLSNATVWNIVQDDMAIIYSIEKYYRRSIEILYEREHSLEGRIKQLLNTDVDTNNAETRELIEKLIDMKGALMEKEERERTSTNKQKVSTVGGAVINFAKKKN